MTEYWKSLARKFCDFCKCWLTDNKPSIEFHEKGKKHQENVKKRLAEIAKKGRKDYLQQKKMDKDMAKMEKAALKALKKDIEANPELASQYGAELASLEDEPSSSAGNTKSFAHVQAPIPRTLPDPIPVNSSASKKKKKLEKPAEPPKMWYEAVSDEGYTYFWNVETQESRWEAPEQYVSLSEQQASTEEEAKPHQENTQAEKPTDSELTKKFEHYKEKIAKENEEDEFVAFDSCNAIGPKGKPDPYGKWTLVPENKPADKTELQLPKTDSEYTQVIVAKKESVKFKEKVIDSSTFGPSDGANVGFKRRKVSSFKRNIRRRGDDEEAS